MKNFIPLLLSLSLLLFICSFIYIRNYRPLFLSDKMKDKFYDLFEKFDKICKENDIRYFIIAGTLLGSLRHREMIPWDDDIDVGILNEDLEKFKKINFSSYGLQQRGVSRDNIGKIFYENQYDNGNKYESVFIDIFVFEKVENRYQYTHKYALDKWENEFFYEKELFPLRHYPFKNLSVTGPNESLPYSTRAWGKNWANLHLHCFIKYLYYPEKLF